MNKLIVLIGVILCIQSTLVLGARRARNHIDHDDEHVTHDDDDHVPTTTPAPPIEYTITNEVWFNFTIRSGDHEGEVLKTQKVVIGLFGDICPMTVTNFVQIAKGFKRQDMDYHYKNTTVHRIIKDFMIQMGDFINEDGSGSLSIYGDRFIDENFILSHRSAGWVSMANYGVDANGSQFFITLVPARWLDKHHVVFGRVLSGMDMIRAIGEVDTYSASYAPKDHVEITDCGVNEVNKYKLPTEELDNPGDIKH